MKNIKYILLFLLISQSQLKEENDILCQEYGEINDLKECFNNTVPSHHFCCGLNITISNETYITSCKDLPASNISVNMFKEHLIEEFNGKFKLICPEKEEDIKGICSEFINFPVEDGNKCLSLVDETNKICCSLTYKMDKKIDEFPFPPNYTECISMPNDKSKIDEEIKKMNNKYFFEGLKLVIDCGNVNKSYSINYYSLISLLILFFLFI